MILLNDEKLVEMSNYNNISKKIDKSLGKVSCFQGTLLPMLKIIYPQHFPVSVLPT